MRTCVSRRYNLLLPPCHPASENLGSEKQDCNLKWIGYIRSGDLSDISDDDKFLKALPGEPIFDLVSGDVLVSSIGFGSIGKVQVFDKEGRYGTVGEVSVIRQNEFNSYYLMFFLRSQAGQIQIEKYITGATGQLHLYPRDISKIFVPKLSINQQNEFEKIAKSNLEARQRSKEFLEKAKRAVEIAIEFSEEEAMKFLEGS